jgi:hypothetical protein
LLVQYCNSLGSFVSLPVAVVLVLTVVPVLACFFVDRDVNCCCECPFNGREYWHSSSDDSD